MECQLILLLLVAFECFISFSIVKGNPQDDSYDLVAIMKLRKKTTRQPDSGSPQTTSTEPPTTTTYPHCFNEECPPSDYCVGSRNSLCLCEYDCCYPSCPEGQKIDYDNCPSCTNCTCLPDDGSTTTPFECYIDCDREGCDWRIDYDACECNYFNCGAEAPKSNEGECDLDCSDRPECDWKVDYDLCQCVYSNCVTEAPQTAAIDCDIDCPDHPECNWRVDYDECKCVYTDCPTSVSTTPRSRVKRMKCLPVISMFDKFFS